MSKLRQWIAALPLALFIALAALCYPAEAEVYIPLSSYADLRGITVFLNSYEKVQIEGPEKFVKLEFTPARDGQYSFQTAWDGGGRPLISALLYEGEDERPVGQSTVRAGETLLTVDMKADAQYTLIMSGAEIGSSGLVSMEVMLEAHGRSVRRPIELTGETTRYSKKIIQPRDTHWYAFTAPASGVYAIRSETDQPLPLDVRAYLFDGEHAELGYSDDLLFPDDPNFCIYAELTAGHTYFIRVSAFSNDTGQYRLALIMPSGGEAVPEGISLNETELYLEIGQTRTVAAQIKPQDAFQDVVWASSDYGVASVTPDGVITAVASGRATITALVYGGQSAKVAVEVAPIPLQSIGITRDEIAISEGETAALELEFFPWNASNQTVYYRSESPSVATVDEDGSVVGHQVGETSITVTSEDGGWSASVRVRVTERRPVTRALIVSENDYPGDDNDRIGAVNTARGISDALSHGLGESKTNIALDISRAQLVAQIDRTFEGAQPGDLSLFYINCHGGMENGTAYLELHNGDRITAIELERMLSKVGGHVVVVLDFCNSGAFIGKSRHPALFTADASVVRGYRSEQTVTPFTTGRYLVLTSSNFDQKSIRLGNTKTEAQYSTALGRVLCEGLGWDLIRDRRRSVAADLNGDRKVTFQELYEYTQKHVHRLTDTYNLQELHKDPNHRRIEQDVQAFPLGSGIVIFDRSMG